MTCILDAPRGSTHNLTVVFALQFGNLVIMETTEDLTQVENLLKEVEEPTHLLAQDDKIYKEALSCLSCLSKDLKQLLFTDNLHHEQVWGQLSLIQQKLLPGLSSELEKHKDSELFESEDELSEDELQEPQEPQEPQESQESQESQEESYEASGLEDDFLKIDELEQFVDGAELDQEDEGFSESAEEDNSKTPETKYKDFFKQPQEKDIEEEQEAMFTLADPKELDRIENELVSEKPWQLKGETSATQRPLNSLLDEKLDFELARTPAPTTQTPQVTDSIEEVIKQRVLDMAFDDVRPKIPLNETKAKTAAEDFMDYEKSKKSLAELYEEDYKKQVLHIPQSTEQEHAKKEATYLFRKLCYNLDLLSSLNPVAKPVVKDLEVKSSDLPALALEEVLPFGVNTDSIKAPKEVFNPKEATVKATEEMTKQDKNSLRRNHKKTLRTRKKERITKLINKAAQDPRMEKFAYRKMLKEEKAKKELIERKKQTKTKFTRNSEFFKNMQKITQEDKVSKKPDPSLPSKKVKL